MKPGKTFIFSCFLETSFAESGCMIQYKIIGYIIKGVMSYGEKIPLSSGHGLFFSRMWGRMYKI